MRILVTGFEPFRGRTVNPSWEAVRELDGEVVAGAWIRALRIPVVYGDGVAAIVAALEQEPVDALLIGGLAYGRAAVSVEALAHAVGDMPWSPDNAGRALANERTAEGPDALLATAPVRAIARALNEAGIPAVVSWDGGTYVSNATLYGALRYARDHAPALRATYVHVPALPEMTTGTAVPSLPLAVIVRAFRIACEVLATHEGADVTLARWPTVLEPLPS
jgi:pyroglutamyl-peptidase